jgi:hemoglobin-like flavoprotein
MTPEQLVLVRESWRRFEPRLRDSGLRFYEQLFALDPTVAHLFDRTDLVQQERKIMGMLAEIVRVLDRPGELVPEVAALGQRHVGYGVRDDDYASIGAALLWLLEQVLGEEFTPELKAAWSEAYALVSSIMRRAAAREHLISREHPIWREHPT